MSEQKLREYLNLDHFWRNVSEGECNYCYGFSCHKDDCEVDKALSESPDAAAMLRCLNNEMQIARRAIGDPPGDEYYCGKARSFEEMIAWTEDRFHIHLTDDGWEYTKGKGIRSEGERTG